MLRAADDPDLEQMRIFARMPPERKLSGRGGEPPGSARSVDDAPDRRGRGAASRRARCAAPRAAPPPAVAPVFVNVNASPWAEIEIDGEPVGETPIARLAVPPGRHRVAARMPDGRVLEREVHIRESGSRVVFP